MFQRLPEDVRNTCLRGLALLRRMPASVKVPPKTAQDFAETITGGFQMDAVMARDCVDAHIQLDKRCVDVGADGDYGRVCRMLYGGDLGRDWAERLLADTNSGLVPVAEPVREREPVLADIDNADSEFADLCAMLNRVNERARDRIDAAIKMAYLGALRSLTNQAADAVLATMSKGWREEVGQDVVELRAEARALYRHVDSPYIAAQLIPEPVMAELTFDQQRAIEDSIADLEVTAREVLEDAHSETIEALASQLDTTEAEIRGELGDLLEEQRSDAASLLVASLTAFTLSRADRTDGEVSESLESAVIPAAIAVDVLNVAGGAARSGTTTARSGDGVVQLVDGTQTEVEGPTSFLMNRTFARVVGAVPVVTMEWVYGSRSTRVSPREDHVGLDGLRWTGRSQLRGELGSRTGEVAGDVAPDVWPGSLFGCQCLGRPVGINVPGRT